MADASPIPATTPATTMRLDRFLWFARLTRTRAAAQVLATSGHLRIDGRAIDRAHAVVRPGNVLTFVHHARVRVIRIESLPIRRGPAGEACLCQTELLPAIDAAPPEN